MIKPTTAELAHIAALIYKEKVEQRNESGQSTDSNAENAFQQAATDAFSLWTACHDILKGKKQKSLDEILQMALLPTGDYEDHWDRCAPAMDDFEREHCISYQKLVSTLWPGSGPKKRTENLERVLDQENLKEIVLPTDPEITKNDFERFHFSIQEARQITRAKKRMVTKSKSKNSKAGVAKRSKSKKK